MDYASFEPESFEPIPFEVKSGEVTYLCNCHIEVVIGKNFFGLPMEENAKVVITNKRVRDMGFLQAKYPFVETLRVVEVVR